MRKFRHILVTGGLGFIGSAFIRYLLEKTDFDGKITNLDAVTYAANFESLQKIENHERYRFVEGNILDASCVEDIVKQGIDAIVHFAAETHVDRSIDSAFPFFQTNVMGTVCLLEIVRKYPSIHFHHVSTDEVYGSLGPFGFFNESSHYNPNSPYSASKAASDHVVRSFAHTYNLSTTISHCSNNFGPFQNREKLIPLMIEKLLNKELLPVYGQGKNVRDWLFVEDHAEAIYLILQKGKINQTYDIGGDNELSNLHLIHILIDMIAAMTRENPQELKNLIAFVQDRPGHDFRYAIDAGKIKQLGWHPKTSFKEGLLQTIQFYSKSFKS